MPADLDALVELDADPQVMRYISYGEPTPRARYEQDYLPRFLAYYTSTPLVGYWIAETRADDEFIGWFHLRPDRIDAGEQEIGYRLRRAAWGQGYATELGRALVAHGFERVGAPVISARALRGQRSLATRHGEMRSRPRAGLHLAARGAARPNRRRTSRREVLAVAGDVAQAAGLRKPSQWSRPASSAGRPLQISAVRARSRPSAAVRSALPAPHSSSLPLSCSSRCRVRW